MNGSSDNGCGYSQPAETVQQRSVDQRGDFYGVYVTDYEHCAQVSLVRVDTPPTAAAGTEPPTIWKQCLVLGLLWAAFEVTSGCKASFCLLITPYSVRHVLGILSSSDDEVNLCGVLKLVPG